MNAAAVEDEVAAEGQLGEPGREDHRRGVAREVALHNDHGGGVSRQDGSARDDRIAVDGPQQQREDEVVQEDETEEPLTQEVGGAHVEVGD